jgi:uncharacterized lipoprotein YmbA
MTHARSLAVATAALLLAACQSAPPIRQYTLIPPSAAVAASAAQDPAWVLVVDPVAVPAQVDVPYIVIREGRSQLVQVETQRWAAPLADEVRGALIEGIRAANGAATVAATADGAIPAYRLKVALRRFDSVLGRQALVDAAWTIESTQDATRVASCDSQVAASIASGYPALADGHQRALADLARRIATGLDALHAGRSESVCVVANGG